MTEAQFKIDISVREKGAKSPSWNLDTDLGGSTTLVETTNFLRNALIQISKEALREEQANGFTKTPLTIVDGKYNASIESVKPFGKIQFVAELDLDEALLFIYQGLLERSPVDSGAYKSSHVVAFNGRQVAKNMDQLKTWLDTKPEFSDKDRINFVNYQHYAGKLERYGNTAQRKSIKIGNGKKKKGVTPKVKKPNGVYWLTYGAAKSKFGRNVFIAFEFKPGSYFSIPRAENSRHEYVYPSILVLVFKSGIQ